MAFQSLYENLGVPSTATAEEIKDAYRRQAMNWHPDRNPSNKVEAESRFKEIGYAYKVLSDPERRTAYDNELKFQQSESESTNFDAGARPHDSTREEADGMFFEQMLDLAFELSRRGFDPDKILKMLLALDCPEGLARAVKKRLEDLGAAGSRSNGAGSSKRERTAEHGHSNPTNPIGSFGYAGFWERAEATFVDGIAVTLMGVPILILFSRMNVGLTSPTYLYWVVSWIPGWLYYGFCESGIHQATWGKRALGQRVTDIYGNRISFGRASGRYFGRVLSLITIYIGYLIQPFTARKQALHDKLAGTVVVRIEKQRSWKVTLAFILLAIPIVGVVSAIAIPQYAEYMAKAERNSVQEIVKSALTVRMAMQDNPKLTESQIAGMNLWNTGFLAKMSQEPKATDELVNIFKEHPEFKIGIDSKSYDQFALHYVYSDRVAWHLQSGKQPQDAIRSAYADLQRVGFAEAVANAKAYSANVIKQQQRMAVVVADLEARYPELDENSPRFNQVLTDAVLARQQAYIDKGLDAVIALTTAVSDMEREAAARSGNR